MIDPAVRVWVESTRRAQVLPPTVEDQDALEQLADDVIDTLLQRRAT